MVDLTRIAASAFVFLLALQPGGTLSAPRSRLAREALVFWQGWEHCRRLRRPGSYELELPCSFVAGSVEHMTVVIALSGEAGGAEGGYSDCTAEEVHALAAAGREGRVRFGDRVTEIRLFGETGTAAGGSAAFRLADGRSVTVACSLSTAAGLKCLVPTDRPELQAGARAIAAQDKVTISGRLLPREAGSGASCVLVEGIQLPGEPRERDEPPWTATVWWAGREALRASECGDYLLKVPCLHREGAIEQGVLRLREFRVVDLMVDGHPVVAELADTPYARSWGLQGRSGLAPDEGMLFFFEQPLRPVFVMKAVSFPIAVAFVADDGGIVSIEKLRPGDQRGVTSAVPVRHVLEMEQGWFDEHGVQPGRRVLIP